MSKTRLQDEYNKAITECHIFVSLFHTKVGIYTEEEFLKALETFKANGNLRIYTYFKDAPINAGQIGPEIMTLLNFKERLHNLGHFHTSYADINDLKHKFSEQLNKIMPKLAGEIEPAFHQEQQEIEQSLKSQNQQLEQQLEQDRLKNAQLLERISRLTEQLINCSSATEKDRIQSRIKIQQKKLIEKEPIISQLQEQIKQLQFSLKIVITGEIELKSEKGIDYTKLRDLLAAGKWEEADQETAKVMCQAAGREKEGYLDTASINNFPCEDVRTINQLWLHYSKGKDGFSVQ
ncbi:GUN4 domain protein (fragment) [Microcystis aeruginosa PCC 9806]|uniref:GUN4 domain-containing protein n=2 Tax=Microcystis TaxID=1125 RepID=A0A552LAS5_9CHRO